MKTKRDVKQQLSDEFWIKTPQKFSEAYRFSIHPVRFFATLFLRQRNSKALKNIVLHLDDTIVDMGCGSGNLIDLFGTHCKFVYAVDISKKMLEEAKDNNNSNNVEYIQTSCDACPLDDESVDKVISLGLLDYVPDIQSVLIEINRILKSGGIAVITVPKKPSLFSFLRWFIGLRKTLTNMPPLVNIVSRKEILDSVANLNFEVKHIESLWTTMWMLVIQRSTR